MSNEIEQTTANENIYWVATKRSDGAIDTMTIEKTKDKDWPEILRLIAETIEQPNPSSKSF